MLMPCEVAVKCVLPSIRALVAKKLTQEYGLKQRETGNLLGITQAAVSQYLRKARGTTLDLEENGEINNLVKKIVYMLCEKSISSKELTLKICSVCEAIRKMGLMCKPHKNLEPELAKECEVCFI